MMEEISPNSSQSQQMWGGYTDLWKSIKLDITTAKRDRKTKVMQRLKNERKKNDVADKL